MGLDSCSKCKPVRQKRQRVFFRFFWSLNPSARYWCCPSDHAKRRLMASMTLHPVASESRDEPVFRLRSRKAVDKLDEKTQSRGIRRRVRTRRRRRKRKRKRRKANNNTPSSTHTLFGNSLGIPLVDLTLSPKFCERCHLPFHGSEIPLDHTLGPGTLSHLFAR